MLGAMVKAGERIDGVARRRAGPFSVPYGPGRVNAKHAYGLFATIVDGSNTWQNTAGIAVLTGGPTSGVDALLVTAVPARPRPSPARHDERPDHAELLGGGIAALIKQEHRNPRQPPGPAHLR